MKLKYVAAIVLLVSGAASAQAFGPSSGSPGDLSDRGELSSSDLNGRPVSGNAMLPSSSSRPTFEDLVVADVGFVVSGNSYMGSSGSTHHGSAVRPESGPHPIAMLLAGLGLMAAVALRRRNR